MNFQHRKYRVQGLCGNCGKEDAYTMNGHAYCFECTEKKRMYYHNNKSHYSTVAKERRERLKSEGICVMCGKNKAIPEHTLCEKCRNIQLRRDRIRRMRAHKKITYTDAVYMGLCTQCKKEPSIKGKRLCQKCYDKAMIGIEAMHAANREKGNKNHIWRRYNELISPQNKKPPTT